MPVTLDIREQPSLPVHRQIEICADGVHHRLFRSSLTLSIVVLAIAFLMNVLTESMIARACKQEVFAMANDARTLSRLESFFQGPFDAAALRRRIVDAAPNTWPYATLMTWLEMDANTYASLRQECIQADTAFGWLEALSMGHRRLLMHGQSDEECLLMLTNPDDREQFVEALKLIPTLVAPPELYDFAERLTEFSARVEAAVTKANIRLAAFEQSLGDHSISSWFAQTDRAAIAATLNRHGIVMEDGTINDAVSRAHNARQYARVYSLLARPEISVAWQKTFGEIFELAPVIRRLDRDPKRLEWFVEQSRQVDATAAMSQAELAAALKDIVEQRDITQTEDRLIAGYGREEGMGDKVFWLIVVSLLVCIVGIANAMLVSVLERFREIATMKCLGALNSFIAVLFLLEAGFLGVVGGLIGVVLGFLIGWTRMMVGFGGWAVRAFPPVDILQAAGISIVTGMLLAVLAAIYPALLASKMPPMEAMRIE